MFCAWAVCIGLPALTILTLFPGFNPSVCKTSLVLTIILYTLMGYGMTIGGLAKDFVGIASLFWIWPNAKRHFKNCQQYTYKAMEAKSTMIEPLPRPFECKHQFLPIKSWRLLTPYLRSFRDLSDFMLSIEQKILSANDPQTVLQPVMVFDREAKCSYPLIPSTGDGVKGAYYTSMAFARQYTSSGEMRGAIVWMWLHVKLLEGQIDCQLCCSVLTKRHGFYLENDIDNMFSLQGALFNALGIVDGEYVGRFVLDVPSSASSSSSEPVSATESALPQEPQVKRPMRRD